MKKILTGTAAAVLALTIPVAANAQRLGAAVVAVADIERIGRECNACRAAQATLQQQLTSLQQRATQLGQPLQTESQQLQTAVNALNGKQPDAGLQQRIQAFQTRQNTANQELAREQQTFERNRAYVSQQLAEKLEPVYRTVMQNRGASVLVDAGVTLAISPSIDVTNDVMTLLNQQVSAFNTTAPAPAAQPQQPQQPRPQGGR